ncbi:MAG: hypothetical protein JXA66_04140 [Oligoflexia bacterium]|nr:hypothetical protein [Oligoflexia bacterium]
MILKPLIFISCTGLCLLAFSSCSSIRNSKPVFDKNISRDVPFHVVKTSSGLGQWKRDAKPGKLGVVVQAKRGRVKFSPDIKDILTSEFKKISLFTDVYYYLSNDIDIWSIDGVLARAKKEGITYMLIMSYYDNNSASLNTFHAAFKTATFNMYDFVPVFTAGMGTFNHYYAATLEATLVDLSTGFYAANWQSTSLLEKFARGGNDTESANDIYINDAFRLAATGLSAKIATDLLGISHSRL